MQAIPALVVFILVSMMVVRGVALPRDRTWLSMHVALSWLIFAPLVALINVSWPFSGGGDDFDYFILSTQYGASWSDLLNPGLFEESMTQPAFPMLLVALNLALDPGLLGLKYFNLMILILNSLVWYRIGCDLSTPAFGRMLMTVTLLLTPLWFYVLFLLKDLLIVLFQSLFILGLVRTWRSGVIRGWLLAGLAAMALLPLRAPLVLQDAAVALGASGVRLLGPGRLTRRWMMLLVGVPLFLALLYLASKPEFMASMGVTSDQRVLGSEAMIEAGKQYSEESTLQGALFPLLYILSETSGLSPSAWQLDPSRIRGLLAIPWIALVVPSMLLGFRWLLRAAESGGTRQAIGRPKRLLRIRMVATPWAAIVIFILANAVVSWTVGDTTRWRLSDMPALAAIAAAPWSFDRRKQAFGFTVLWITLATAIFSGLYLLRQF